MADRSIEMGTALLLNFPKLEGAADYKDWARSMKNILAYEGCWDTMFNVPDAPDSVLDKKGNHSEGESEGSGKSLADIKAFKRLSMKAHLLISLMCGNGPASLINGNLHGYQDWNELWATYSDKSFTQRYSTFQKLMSTTLDSSDSSVEKYVDTIQSCGQELEKAGTPVPEWVLVSCLLNNLSDKYADITRIIGVDLKQTEPAFDAVVTILHRVDRRLKKEEQIKAWASEPSKKEPQTGKSSDHRSDKEAPKCLLCPKTARGTIKRHSPKACWTRHPELMPENYRLFNNRSKKS